VRIAAFISHPIQYFTPLWQELSSRPGVELEVFYFARQGLDATLDPGFGVRFAWNIDLLAGHKHEFLPRQWPTRDPADYRPRALNKHMTRVLQRGWDAVFVSGYASWNNWLIAAECKRLGIPMLCFGDTNPRTDLGKPLPRLAVKRAALALYFRGVSAFLAAGGQSRDYFVGYGAARESVFICPYAVDVARFRSAIAEKSPEQRAAQKQRWGIPEGKRVVMFCGKLVAWKRPLDVLDAVERLGRSDTVAVFVGEGELRAALEARRSPYAVLTGFVNQGEIPLALSLADVLVLPSSVEPYGMVVAEAQCLGVPAVVSDTCGCHGPDSVLQDGQSGFVYPMGDVPALAHKLGLLLGDDALRGRMSQAARVQGDTQSQLRAADGLLAAAVFASRQAHGRRRVGGNE
jgi:glycosyltransferase involved in cell wall biosynthesis